MKSSQVFYLMLIALSFVDGYLLNYNRLKTSNSIHCKLHSSYLLNNKQINLSTKLNMKSNSPLGIITNQSVSLGIGIVGIIALLINRLSLDLIVSDVQSRSDLISVIACSALLLNVLSEQEIETKERDIIPLVGYALQKPLLLNNNLLYKESIIYLINTIIKSCTSITSVHMIENYQVIAIGGVIGSKDNTFPLLLENKSLTIQKVLKQNEPLYLPDLQVCIWIR